mmetsp:Transcript_4136/g.6013  ORF Transcript_4136/g.6013 Transcript_4136/m.6013 type:complete len:755 (+) Transcript_4136:327-2591(+)
MKSCIFSCQSVALITTLLSLASVDREFGSVNAFTPITITKGSSSTLSFTRNTPNRATPCFIAQRSSKSLTLAKTDDDDDDASLFFVVDEVAEGEEDEEEENEEEENDEEEKLDIDSLVNEVVSSSNLSDPVNGVVNDDVIDETLEGEEEEEEDEETLLDKEMMNRAIQMAQSSGGERGSHSPFPKPIVGAVLATNTGKVLSSGRSNYEEDAVEAVIRKAGIKATPLSEWCVSWPSDPDLRSDLRNSTLYITLEPSSRRKGMSFPPITQLIQMSGISRCVIGCSDPIPEYSSEGASALHSAGLDVKMGVAKEECERLIDGYSKLANTKLQKMARKHYQFFGRPLGFLHCSVVDSDDVQAFANNGNAFAKNFGGQSLSFRDFGSYELAPPPDSIWANNDNDSDNDDTFTEKDDFFNLEFDDEDEQENLGNNPMMPWYEQVDAVVATFPREGNGPIGDQSIMARLNGLKWLATSGNMLPANVERILVMDATDLCDLPLSNDDPNLPPGVDVESFWKGDGRKKSRILLRSGDNAQAIAAANAAAEAAGKAAEAAQCAKEAIESGEAELAAEAAIRCQQAALAATTLLQKEMQISQDLKQKLISLGAKVEVMRGKEPVDVMNHLGKTNGYTSVVWRAGCWGQRGVRAIVAGAFQWISAHLAVDAVGGKFWQLMLAERAIQGACGSESRVKVLAEQEDISLEYCDEEDADCELTVNGKPIRHIRLDCRVLVENPERKRNYILTKTAPVKDKLADAAPWFL